MTRRTCLVTGAGGRLGTALCRHLSARYDILATYRRRPPDVASQVAWPVDSMPGGPESPSVHVLQADLSRREDIRRLVEVAQARFHAIDVLINCAADTRFHGKLLELWDADDYAGPQLQANAVAPLRLASALHQAMWKDDQPTNTERNRCVINLSSVSGLYVYQARGQAFYGASKAALNMLTMYLALELAPYGVRANAICPRRFTEDEATAGVVRAIERIIDGDATGRVLEEPFA